MISDRIVWEPPVQPCSLGEGEVHVWRVGLQAQQEWSPRLVSLLSEEERTTAERFRFPRDRDCYIVSHAALRSILVDYCGDDIRRARFLVNDFGKPYVGEREGSIHFNLSHTVGMALIAVARSFAVGIDVECRRAERFDMAIARRFFSPFEYDVLEQLPAHEQVDAFFRCWVRKEAFIKARGTGLSFPLHQFDVSVEPGRPAQLIAIRGADERADAWSLIDVPLDSAYSAALAVPAPDVTPRWWHWQPSADMESASR